MKSLLIAAAAVAAPAFAQAPTTAPAPPPAATAPAATAEAVDPARLAVARQTIDYVWPLGTYQRLMNGPMMNEIMQSVFSMRLGDLAPPGATGSKPVDPKLANATLGDMMVQADPNFQKRMQITMQVIASETAPIMAKFEPDLREGLARAFARKFTVEQLGDMNRFFVTPGGRAYASESLLIMADPNVIQSWIKAMPAMMQAMPQIMKKVQDATKDLPPPPGAHHPATPHATPHPTPPAH